MTQKSDQNLRCQSIERSFGDIHISADFQVQVGELAALVGPSGAGKTTLLRMIAGLDHLDSGQILIGDQRLDQLPPEKRNIGLVFQENTLLPHFNLFDNITLGLRFRGVSLSDRENEACLWLERVGLLDRIMDPVDRLSGGERQRAAFIQAVIFRPKILLLDEPFSALDSENRQNLRKLLVELHALWPVPMILVSHDERDVESVATCRIQLSPVSTQTHRKFIRQQ